MGERLQQPDAAEAQAISLVEKYSDIVRISRACLSHWPNVPVEERERYQDISFLYFNKKISKNIYIEWLEREEFQSSYFTARIARLSHPLDSTLVAGECLFFVETDGKYHEFHHPQDTITDEDISGFFQIVLFSENLFPATTSLFFKAIAFVEIEPGLAAQRFDSFSPEEQTIFLRSLLSVEGQKTKLQDPINHYSFKFPCAVCRIIPRENPGTNAPVYRYSQPLVIIPPQEDYRQYRTYNPKTGYFLQIPSEKTSSSK